MTRSGMWKLNILHQHTLFYPHTHSIRMENKGQIALELQFIDLSFICTVEGNFCSCVESCSVRGQYAHTSRGAQAYKVEELYKCYITVQK